jgi:hypothetical protein
MVKSGDYAKDKGQTMGLRARPDSDQSDLKSAKAMGLKRASKVFSSTRDAMRAPVYRRPI